MLLKRIDYSLNNFVMKALSIFIALIISFGMTISPSYAASSSMSGDYVKDTITVVKTLKVAIERWPGGDSNEQENLHHLLMIFNTIVLEADLELDAKDRE